MVFLGRGFHFRITGHGPLHCHRCGGDRDYRKCVGRRWFHVFWLPVLPMDRVAEHVQCTSCGTRYRLEVLAMPTSAQMRAALPNATRGAVAAMLRAGDRDSELARTGAIEAVRKAGAAGYDDAALAEDLASDDAQELAAALGTLAVQMTMPAHEWFLAGVVRVGLCDGQLTEEERTAARTVAAYLGLTPAQAHGVIWLTEENAAAG